MRHTALLATAAIGFAGAAASAADITRFDFDANSVGGRNLSFSATPDNSANNGAFPNSIFDVFGVTDRTVNFDFADDTAGSFAGDTFGILKTGKTDKVFGAEDLDNSDFASVAVANWSFDISGFTDVFVSIDFAAMGDFEASNDSFNFFASIDGGAETQIFTSSVREDLDPFTYTLESGSQVQINDPLAMNGVVLSNDFQALSSAILGSGSTLNLRFEATSNGSSEVFVFDDISIQGVPTPGAVGLFGLAGLVASRRRRA